MEMAGFQTARLAGSDYIGFKVAVVRGAIGWRRLHMPVLARHPRPGLFEGGIISGCHLI